MQKTLILMNKPLYLGLSTLEMSEIVMHVLLHDYVKPKQGEKTKLCYMDTSSFIVYIRTDNSYVEIVKDAETRFDTSNQELDRLLLKRKNKKSYRINRSEPGVAYLYSLKTSENLQAFGYFQGVQINKTGL